MIVGDFKSETKPRPNRYLPAWLNHPKLNSLPNLIVNAHFMVLS